MKIYFSYIVVLLLSPSLLESNAEPAFAAPIAAAFTSLGTWLASLATASSLVGTIKTTAYLGGKYFSPKLSI